MLDFILNITEFALQAAVIVVGILVIIAFIASIISKSRDSDHLKITNLNKKLAKNKASLLKSILNKKDLKKTLKELKAQQKNKDKQKSVFVLNFDGDIKASAVEQLREEISSILSVAKKEDQVVVKVESPGGMVHGYGLAASQLQRIKNAGLSLTICVDKIAASGGYMMACIGDKIISAPFAIIGSIGVVASLPNFNKILKKNDVDYLEITAGEYKRTLTTLGEVTEPGMKKFKEQIEEVHELFKKHVSQHRPNLDLSKVATGEYWYGQQCLDLNLVDEIGTSDELLMKLDPNYNIFEVKVAAKKTLQEKLSEGLNCHLESLYNRVSSLLWGRQFQS